MTIDLFPNNLPMLVEYLGCDCGAMMTVGYLKTGEVVIGCKSCGWYLGTNRKMTDDNSCIADL